MLSTETRLTATIGLSSLNAGNFRLPYGVLMAGCALTVLPTAALFALTRRHFRSSLDRLTEA
jgi:ABC-type glycerol-3-phosphate transport system permease component